MEKRIIFGEIMDIPHIIINAGNKIELINCVEDLRSMTDKKCECRLYVGNLDQKITESLIIKMFSPFGKIVSEDFLWHTRGHKRGEPRGYAFIEYSSKEEAQVAKTKMNGRLACGRPLVVRLASEKYLPESMDPRLSSFKAKRPSSGSSAMEQEINRSAKIAAIKSKLKSLEEEGCAAKKQKSIAGISGCEDNCSNKYQDSG